MGVLIPAGIAIIFLGFFLVTIGVLSQDQNNSKDGKSGAKVAIGGFIGPIPFGFGNDQVMLYVATGVSAFLFVIYVVFRFVIN